MLVFLSFVFGFAAGAWLVFWHKNKPPRNIEDSLKKATVFDPLNTPPRESELLQEARAETLEKKMLYEQELALIFKMGREMFSSINLENIAKSIAESANKIINAQICTVLFEDKATQELALFYSQGVSEELISKMRIKKGESISGWVAANNQILVKNNLESDPWFNNQVKDEYFAHSLLSIPLFTKERVIGVLNLSNKKSGQPFTDDEVEFVKGLITEVAIALENAALYEQIQESYLKTISALASALDARDSYTRTHSENVTKYAVAIAREMGLRQYQIEQIRRAGLLHDIGKIGIRDAVLLKPSRLSEEEYNDIKYHPLKGEAIVSALPFLKEEAKLIRHHHERFDGKGYPDGIAGTKIELGARILAVADSFDAMVGNRVYRQALSIQVICEELKNNRGKQFDPDVTDALLKIIQEKPELIK